MSREQEKEKFPIGLFRTEQNMNTTQVDQLLNMFDKARDKGQRVHEYDVSQGSGYNYVQKLPITLKTSPQPFYPKQVQHLELRSQKNHELQKFKDIDDAMNRVMDCADKISKLQRQTVLQKHRENDES